MTKSKLSAKYKFDAYNQRDVMALPALSDWTDEQTKIQTTHNRILQLGFMHRDPAKVLEDAKKTKVDWITNVCCPSASAAITLHIAKEMVTNYQVSETQLDTKAHAVYASLVTNPSILAAIEKEVDDKFDKQFSGARAEKIEKSAKEMLQTEENDSPQDQLDAAKRLTIDSERRKIIDSIVSKKVKEHLNNKAEILGLTPKTRHKIGTTHDFAFLGAAGSGKSTITQQFVSNGPDIGPDPKKINKLDCVILATDNYRAFTLPGTEAHEAIDTKDVFTRTQDVAYMVKELVLDEVKQVSAEGKRPNVVCDCVKLEGPMREFLAQTENGTGTLVSKLAAYRGNPGFMGIAERVDARARNPEADPADKGRFVETTTLLKGHADASRYFLANLPANTETEILDTDVDRDAGQTPVRIALVDGKNRRVEITNLKTMSEFLNKQNLNFEAEHPVELILKDKEKLATSPENKAKSILGLVSGVPPYSVSLNKAGSAYAELSSDNAGGVKLEILDVETFKHQISHDVSPEAQVLRQILRITIATAMNAAKGKAPESPEAMAAKEAKSWLVELADIEYFENAEARRTKRYGRHLNQNATQQEAELVASQTQAMKTQLQKMKGDDHYDVRKLSFPESGFDKMCTDCGFSQKFAEILEHDIKQLKTLEDAGSDPANWILKKYEQWLDNHPEDLEAMASENNNSPTPKALVLSKISQVLQDNADLNDAEETQMRM